MGAPRSEPKEKTLLGPNLGSGFSAHGSKIPATQRKFNKDVHVSVSQSVIPDINTFEGMHVGRNKEIRAKTVELLGGKCSKCPENRMCVLDIHHKRYNGGSHRKDMSVSGPRRFVLNAIEQGSNDYELLCANCHREHHFLNHTPSST